MVEEHIKGTWGIKTGAGEDGGSASAPAAPMSHPSQQAAPSATGNSSTGSGVGVVMKKEEDEAAKKKAKEEAARARMAAMRNQQMKRSSLTSAIAASSPSSSKPISSSMKGLMSKIQSGGQRSEHVALSTAPVPSGRNDDENRRNRDSRTDDRPPLAPAATAAPRGPLQNESNRKNNDGWGRNRENGPINPAKPFKTSGIWHFVRDDLTDGPAPIDRSSVRTAAPPPSSRDCGGQSLSSEQRSDAGGQQRYGSSRDGDDFDRTSRSHDEKRDRSPPRRSEYDDRPSLRYDDRSSDRPSRYDRASDRPPRYDDSRSFDRPPSSRYDDRPTRCDDNRSDRRGGDDRRGNDRYGDDGSSRGGFGRKDSSLSTSSRGDRGNCRFFFTSRGCRDGESCKFSHEGGADEERRPSSRQGSSYDDGRYDSRKRDHERGGIEEGEMRSAKRFRGPDESSRNTNHQTSVALVAAAPSGAGRGRGAHINKPAWLVKQEQSMANVEPTGMFEEATATDAPYFVPPPASAPSPAFDAIAVTTVPASAGVNDLNAAAPTLQHTAALGRGRGRGNVSNLPAWMTQQQGGASGAPAGVPSSAPAFNAGQPPPSSHNNCPVGSNTAFSAPSAGRGRGRGKDINKPAWQTRMENANQGV